MRTCEDRQTNKQNKQTKQTNPPYLLYLHAQRSSRTKSAKLRFARRLLALTTPRHSGQRSVTWTKHEYCVRVGMLLLRHCGLMEVACPARGRTRTWMAVRMQPRQNECEQGVMAGSLKMSWHTLHVSCLKLCLATSWSRMGSSPTDTRMLLPAAGATHPHSPKRRPSASTIELALIKKPLDQRVASSLREEVKRGVNNLLCANARRPRSNWSATGSALGPGHHAHVWVPHRLRPSVQWPHRLFRSHHRLAALGCAR
jgi:hypothetical protein